MNQPSLTTETAPGRSPEARRPSVSKRWRHAPSILIYHLRSRQCAALTVLLIATFLAYFYAADLKGIWNDDAVRLTIANGGVATKNIGERYPGDFAHVIKSNGIYATQPAYLLLVNLILRLTHSYSIIPIVTTNLLIYLLSAVGLFLLARRLLAPGPRFLAVLFYLWNGFAMVHALQVREYPLILCFLVFNTLFFYLLLGRFQSLGRWSSCLVAVAYCLSSAGAFYTTKWAPFFLWPQAVVAFFAIRRDRGASLTALGSLIVAALLCLPSVMSIPKNSVVFVPWDRRPSTFGLLITRFHLGTEHLLVGSHRPALSFLEIYYWGLLFILLAGLVFFSCRFFRERFEIQHLVLTVLGFLAFQIAFFFLREPLSTWPRYFIFYLPYVVLLIPLSFSRALSFARQPASSRVWAYAVFITIAAAAGVTQIRSNYLDPYVDHGPDFREVYRYLIQRVAPPDKIVVNAETSRMALIYYWPTAQQVQLRYKVGQEERAKPPPSIWIVSYRDEASAAYMKYAEELGQMGYRMRETRIISRVTVRHFEMKQPLLPSTSQHEREQMSQPTIRRVGMPIRDGAPASRIF